MYTEDPDSGENEEDLNNEPKRILDDALAHFRADPQTNEWLENADYEAPDVLNRETMPGGSNRFFQKTLNSPITVPHMVQLVRKDLSAPNAGEKIADIPNNIRRATTFERPPELVSMCCLESDGLDGWPGVTHGGFNCTVLDQAIGHLLSAHRMNSSSGDLGGALLTANLNTSYFRPVQTGGNNIIVKAWVTARTRRKWTAVAQITQDGEINCQGDGLFVVTQNPKI